MVWIAAERAVIDQIGQQIGYGAGEFGAFPDPSGGSLGNLTALLAARNEACPCDHGNPAIAQEDSEGIRFGS